MRAHLKISIVSTYPNVSQLLNIARETCVMALLFAALAMVAERCLGEFNA